MTQDSLIRQHIADFAFQKLFNVLGWDNFPPGSRPHYIEADDATYTFSPISEKKGLQVFECSAAPNGLIPPLSTRKKISRKLAALAFEHLIIFVDNAHDLQKWQWIVRVKGQPQTPYGATYSRRQDATALAQKLHRLTVTLDEDRGIGIVDMTTRMQAAFRATETVTKKFYEQFRKQYEGFLDFIKGIEDSKDQEWYASLMLNRLMFVYFIQSKGFLDGKTDYLRRKFDELRATHGSDEFYNFYRVFLLRLFHEALATQENERDSDLEKLLGDVPYLNGGLFEPHEIERRYPDIRIPDAAFDTILAFFDEWTWHLDTRPERTAKEINPDVLGYIFEQFINRKQMGAYYTKEDITGYISKNTVIPWLFDAAKSDDTVAFRPDGEVWHWLQDRPDAYIYPSMLDGVIDEAGSVKTLPADIAAGIEDVSKRTDWNKPAAQEYALPTETWREHAARRQRVLALREKLASGVVTQINDLITDNLDIQTFAQDVLIYCESPDLLRAFYDALSRVTVLDPTCGSGAFLFAALNVLAPLYQACLDGMRRFVEEGISTHAARIFTLILAEMDAHPNPDYFITKKIIVTNLYGTDIMPEAVEICKLRLFLKLASQLDNRIQIEPLPDIDFNIRAGNTLIGFASLDDVSRVVTRKLGGEAIMAQIAEQARIVDHSYQDFHRQLNELGGTVTTADKATLRNRLSDLGAELDTYLAAEYGIVESDAPNEYPERFATWRKNHQPFHWFSEFYGIMTKGGFDVIIGNPPYVEYNVKLREKYTLTNYITLDCGNLHAFIAERSLQMAQPLGRLGLIVPLPTINTIRMTSLQNLIKPRKGHDSRSLFVAAFDERPSSLFTGVDQRLVIELFGAIDRSASKLATTGINRWLATTRDQLFPSLSYTVQPDDILPLTTGVLNLKQARIEASMLQRLYRNSPLEMFRSKTKTQDILAYRTAGGRYWKVTLDKPFDSESLSNKVAYLTGLTGRQAVAIVSSSTFWWYYSCHYDMYNLKDYMIFGFRLSDVSPRVMSALDHLGRKLVVSLTDNSSIETVESKTRGMVTSRRYVAHRSKPIIDEIDRVLAQHYGFTETELDFIVNYDIKFRVGRESAEDA